MCWLDEYTTAGVLVQSIELPTTTPLALTDSGKASSGGQFSLSADGTSINLFGYDVNSGTGSATSSASETAAVVGANGTAQLEQFVDQATSNARSAVYDPSTGKLYTSGGLGLFESTFSAGGTPTTTQIVSGSTGNVQIVSGDVYYSSGTSVFRLAGEPTTATGGTTVVSDGSGNSPGQFFFARLGTGPTYQNTSADTIYVADSKATNGTLFKFTWNGSTWSAAGTITGPNTGSGNQILGVTGIGSTIYFTEGNTGSSTVGDVYKFTDAFSTTISNATSSPTRIVHVTANENFRSILTVPIAAISTTPAVTTASGTSGNPVTLTATVTVASGTPGPSSGVVEFFSGGTLIATATSETVSSNVATFTFTGSISVGTYSNIQAEYISGGGGYTNSNSTGTGPTINVVAPPTVMPSSANLAIDAPSFTITGTNFSSTAANDSVTFNRGAVGTVTGATTNSLTVSFTQAGDVAPTSTGGLTAIVTVNGVSSGSAVTVATVVPAPTVTMTNTSLLTTATTVTITGTGFDTTTFSNNTVVLNLGAAGTVTGATTTSLTVTLTSEFTSTGTLTGVVTTDGGSSGSPVQIAAVSSASFTPGNLAVLELANNSNNTTGTVLELNATTANQTLPVQTIGISSMSFSDSGTSSFLSDTSDGTLLTFAAYNTTNYTATSDLADDTAANARGVGTLNPNGAFTLQTTYTEISAGKQTRSATSTDDSNWLITDKQGTYTNGSSGNWIDFNTLNTRSFGGVIYISSTAPTAPAQISPAGDTSGAIPPAAVMTLASPTSIIAVGLPGLPMDGSIQDFYLIQSGSNGNLYDILYTLDSTGVINKFSLTNAGQPSATWVSNGTFSIGGSPLSMVAENNGTGGAALFVVTNTKLEEFNDTAGYNATINITGSPVTLYKATGTNVLKGLAFTPAAVTHPSQPDLTVSLSARAKGLHQPTVHLHPVRGQYWDRCHCLGSCHGPVHPTEQQPQRDRLLGPRLHREPERTGSHLLRRYPRRPQLGHSDRQCQGFGRRNGHRQSGCSRRRWQQLLAQHGDDDRCPRSGDVGHPDRPGGQHLLHRRGGFLQRRRLQPWHVFRVDQLGRRNHLHRHRYFHASGSTGGPPGRGADATVYVVRRQRDAHLHCDWQLHSHGEYP